MLTFQEIRELQQALTVALFEFRLYPFTVDEALLKTVPEEKRENLQATCEKLLTLLAK